MVAATRPMLQRPCYRLTFSDGAQIVADWQHQWVTSDRAGTPSPAGTGNTMTTGELARTIEVFLSLAPEPDYDQTAWVRRTVLAAPAAAA